MSTPCEPREDLFLVIAAGDVWFFGVCVDMGRRDFVDWFERYCSNKELPVGFSDCEEEDRKVQHHRNWLLLLKDPVVFVFIELCTFKDYMLEQYNKMDLGLASSAVLLRKGVDSPIKHDTAIILYCT